MKTALDRSWRGLLGGVLAAVALAWAVPTAAQASGGMPVYVSERFQRVAERVSLQIALEQVGRVCPVKQPLCQAMIASLQDAAAAGLGKNQALMKSALNDFLVAGASASLMDATVGELMDEEQAGPELAGALRPVVRCLGALVDRKRAGEACHLTSKETKPIVDALVKSVCDRSNRRETCVEAANRLRANLEAPTIEAGDLARALAPIAALDPLRRTDIELYLKILGDFLDRHPEAGLFEATLAYVTSARSQDLELALLSEDRTRYELLGSGIEQFAEALGRCGVQEEVMTPWRKGALDQTWVQYRAAVILGQRPALAALNRLMGIDGSRCPNDEDRAQVKQLKGYARTLKGQLVLAHALRTDATLGLIAATAIDFARNGDRVQLEANLRRSVAFGLAQLVAQARVSRLLAERSGERGATTPAMRASARDVLRSCEFLTLSALEHLPVAVNDPVHPTCVPLSGEGTRALEGKVSAVAAPEPHPDVVDALDAFAAFVQVQRPDDYDQVLGALLTSQQDTFVAAAKEPLGRYAEAPLDERAMEAVRTAAVQLAKMEPAKVTGAPQVDERQFAVLLTLTEGDQQALMKKRKVTLAQGQQRLLSVLERVKREDLEKVRSKLALPAYQRVLFKQAGTREARAAAYFASAQGILDKVAPEVRASAQEAGLDVDLLVRAISAGVGDEAGQARKLLLQAAAGFLVAQVDAFTTRLLGVDGAACAVGNERGKWQFIWDRLAGACAAKVLIEGAYKPIAEFIWADDFTFSAESASALADKGYRSLIATPILKQTMLIVNVGLGASYVLGEKKAADPAKGEFAALTVLDKFGIAWSKYRSPRFDFESGLFVGGFLDALVRTAADNPDKFWVGGLSAGWTRMWGVDLGLQAHVGGAFPFTFDKDPRLTVGMSLVVPFSYVLE